MTSIGSHPSPLQMLQAQLQSSVTSGSIKSSDQDVLSGALTDIDSSLTAARDSDAPGKPGDIKSKINDLISQEVSSGKLTSDQATELKSVFTDTFAQGGPGGAGGPRGIGGPGGAGGPPPGPPPSDDASDDSDSDDSTVTDASTLLQQFLKSLQDQIAGGNTTYGSSGASANSATASAFSALLVDYKT